MHQGLRRLETLRVLKSTGPGAGRGSKSKYKERSSKDFRRNLFGGKKRQGGSEKKRA